MTDDARKATIEQLIVDAIESALFELHTGLPGTVIDFDPAMGSCSVQLAQLRVYKDPVTDLPIPFTIPPLKNIPIEYPCGGGFAITWPLVPGDEVYLAFMERSLDTLKSSAPGSIVDPLEPRTHDLSDAVARPTMRRRANPLPGLVDGTLRIGLEDGTALLEIFPDGRLVLKAPAEILFGGLGADQPFVRGTELFAWLVGHVHGGPGSPPTAPPPPTILSTLIRGT